MCSKSTWNPFTDELDRHTRRYEEAVQRLDEELTRNGTLRESVEQLRQLVQDLTEENDSLLREQGWTAGRCILHTISTKNLVC